MSRSTQSIRWWWRLQILQWLQSGRAKPLRRAATLLAWWLPCAILPLMLYLSSSTAAQSGLDFLLSLDVPLTLALAALTAFDALGIEAHTSSDDWLQPRAFRSAGLRWISRLRWLMAARWPAGLAFAAALLAAGASARPELLRELLLMAFFGVVGGASFAWVMRRAPSSQTLKPAKPRRVRGLAALSWVAWHETSERFNLQRAAVLGVPALLAAPLGAMAGDAARMLAQWLLLLFVVAICREAAHVGGAIRRWLGTTFPMQLRLTWWIWRHVALGIAATIALFLIWTGAVTHSAGKSR